MRQSIVNLTEALATLTESVSLCRDMAAGQQKELCNQHFKGINEVIACLKEPDFDTSMAAMNGMTGMAYMTKLTLIIADLIADIDTEELRNADATVVNICDMEAADVLRAVRVVHNEYKALFPNNS